MISLLKCELKKFKSTYVNSLSLMGMLSCLFLVTLMFIIRKDTFVSYGNYNWNTFNLYLTQLLIFMAGPIITSFIAVFSIFYEYQSRTMKNLVCSPHGRLEIIVSKIFFVSLFVLIQYALVALLNILIAFIMGFEVNINNAAEYSKGLMTAGFFTLILVPIMMSVTLLFRNFVPPMVLAVVGAISNILVLNWEYSYVSPWAIPADFVFILSSSMDFNMNILHPAVSSAIYVVLFVAFCLIYFKKADQPT